MVYKRYRKTNPINRGFKERTICNDLSIFLETEHSIQPVIGKQIKSGSSTTQSNRRPDMFIQLETHCIIIEIDERQHRGYSDDSARVTDLINDLNGYKLILIRFNPDGYKDSNRIKRRSLFSKTRGDRIYQIGCINKYNDRMNLLKKVIQYHLLNDPEIAFTECKLYYDKFDNELHSQFS